MVDIPYRTIQNYLTDKRSPNTEALQKLHDNGLDIRWLVTGYGTPFLSDQLDPKLVERVFLACADDIVAKILSSESHVFAQEETNRLIGYMMQRNILGIGEVLRSLREYGHIERFEDLEELYAKGYFFDLYEKPPESRVEMWKAVEAIAETMREQSLKPEKLIDDDKEVGQ